MHRPIITYGGRGREALRPDASVHGPVCSSDKAASPQNFGKDHPLSYPIRVDVVHSWIDIHPASLVNYGRLYQIDKTNCVIFSVGRICLDSRDDLKRFFSMAHKSFPELPTGLTGGSSSSSKGLNSLREGLSVPQLAITRKKSREFIEKAPRQLRKQLSNISLTSGRRKADSHAAFEERLQGSCHVTMPPEEEDIGRDVDRARKQERKGKRR